MVHPQRCTRNMHCEKDTAVGLLLLQVDTQWVDLAAFTHRGYKGPVTLSLCCENRWATVEAPGRSEASWYRLAA